MSIRKKMARGVFWSFIEKGGNQIASFLVFTLVVRLVGPEEYGLVSLCYVYIGLVTTFFWTILDGVVSSRVKDDDNLSTAFWGVIGCGALFSLLGLIISYPTSFIFGQPRLAELLALFSVVPILIGLSSLPSALYAQDMNFRVPALRTIIGTAAGGAIGIILAFKGLGALALVAQQITYYIVVNIVLWSCSSWRPKMQFNKGAVKKLFLPGFKTSGTGFITYARDYLPRIFIGLFLSAEAVGFYAFATRIAGAVRDVIFTPLSAVIFPALASLKNNELEQKKILSEIILLLGLFILPIVVGAILIAPALVPLVFGESWNKGVVILQFILISAAVIPFINVINSIFRAHNAMGSLFKVHAYMAGTSIATSLIMAPYGVLPVAISYSLIMLVSFVVYTMNLQVKLSFNLWNEYRNLWSPLLASGVMTASMMIFKQFYEASLGDWLYLALLVLIGGGVYVAVIGILLRDKAKRLFSKIRAIRNKA